VLDVAVGDMGYLGFTKAAFAVLRIDQGLLDGLVSINAAIEGKRPRPLLIFRAIPGIASF
jgi:hypothetical protein